MNNQPLVSILIPVYNSEEFVKGSIESVLNQDYPNMELIISDDASTDKTPEILRSLEKKHGDKIKLFIQENNLGITRNFNFILDHVKGKYIGINPGDDMMLPGKISKQVEVLEQNEALAICGSVTSIINDASDEINVKRPKPFKRNNIYTLKDLIRSGNFLVPGSSYIFRRAFIPSEGFDSRLPIASDSLFFYHTANRGNIYILNEKLTAYRVHGAQISGMGYDVDTMFSLVLCEFYFPDCYKEISVARAACMTQIGRKKFNNGLYREADYYFRMSLKNRFTLKTSILLMLNCVQRIKRVLCAE